MAGLELVETAPAETVLGHPDLPSAADVWPAMIGRSHVSLDLAQFYVCDEPGEALAPVIAAVEAAAVRGVRVRLLVDASFHAVHPETIDRLATRSGIQVRRLDMATLAGGVLHAKLLIVDGSDLFVGSHNFDWRSLSHVQELGVRTDAPAVVRAFLDVFESDWSVAGGGPTLPAQAPGLPDVAFHAGAPVRITPVFSPAGLLPDPSLWDLPRLVGLLDVAARTAHVQILTYQATEDGSWFGDLDSALRRAAARGVQVRLLVSDWSLRPGALEDLKSLRVLDHVEVRFASLPEASRGFIDHARVVHAKYLVVDGLWAWVGTSNWHRGDFFRSRNAGVLLEGSTTGERLDLYFADLWDSPYARSLDPAAMYLPPRVTAIEA